jgi:hypothetical protein
MMEYTQLERGVLDWMADHLDITNLKEQIRASVPTGREYTGVGSFTSLSVPPELPSIHCSSPITGPIIEAKGIEHGGFAILFLDEAGHLNEIEMIANGRYFAESITTFELIAWKESNKSLHRISETARGFRKR